MSQRSRIPLDLRGLSGHEELFRVHGATKRDPAVDAWLAGEPADLRALARTWFTRMRACGSDVLEVMHDGCPVACIADAPFAYVNAFKSHVNVGFFHGSSLADPAGLLQGTGKRMRHVKLGPDGSVDAEALGALIESAYLDIKSRLHG